MIHLYGPRFRAMHCAARRFAQFRRILEDMFFENFSLVRIAQYLSRVHICTCVHACSIAKDLLHSITSHTSRRSESSVG